MRISGARTPLVTFNFKTMVRLKVVGGGVSSGGGLVAAVGNSGTLGAGCGSWCSW